MKAISVVFIFLLVSTLSMGQTKSFELSNPDAIELLKEQLTHLTSKSWKVDRVDTYIRDEMVSTKGWAFLEFKEEDKFEYGGKSGSWELIEGKYLRYKLHNSKDEAHFNFGGIYAVEDLTDTTLVLAKILTSTSDMSRKIYFYSADYYHEEVAKEEHYYRGKINKKVLDSISNLSEEWLLKTGDIFGLYLKGDTITIKAQDSLFHIKRNIK